MVVTFAHPEFLWLLCLLPLFIVTHFYSMRFVKKRALRFANFEAIKRVSGKKRVSSNWFMLLLRFLVVTFLIFSAAGTVFWYEGQSSNNNFVLALDASGSMLVNDFNPNRLQAAKDAATVFVDTLDSRAMVAVVSFSGVAEVETQASDNFDVIRQAIERIDFKSIHGTAIGDALKVSLNLFPDNGKPNTVVLLTDGRENVISKIDFQRILDFTVEQQITVHTIGVGTDGGGNIPGLNVTSTIDSELLSDIADTSGGTYFPVTTLDELQGAYRDIATASDSDIPIRLQIPLIILALVLLFLEWGLVNTKFKALP